MNQVQTIVRRAGGAQAVADASAKTQHPVTVDAVFKWYRAGIRDEHWPLIMRLAGVTVEDLFEANRSLRREATAA